MSSAIGSFFALFVFLSFTILPQAVPTATIASAVADAVADSDTEERFDVYYSEEDPLTEQERENHFKLMLAGVLCALLGILACFVLAYLGVSAEVGSLLVTAFILGGAIVARSMIELPVLSKKKLSVVKVSRC